MQTNSRINLIAEKAKQDGKLIFTSLTHLINKESLTGGFKELRKDAASGIDGITYGEYESKLEENIDNLVARMKAKQYKPQPVRRTYIPKPGKDERRPLGIPSIEDKIVQMVIKEVLTAIFEQDFLDSSHGYRTKRSAHSAIKALNQILMKNQVHYVDEVDIRKFFDRVSHGWMLTCLEQRIGDPNFLAIIKSFLKAGVMEEGTIKGTEHGTPQGGIISPILANIYLHYVLDLWFDKKFKPQAKGFIGLVRYCDDFVVACQFEEDARRFLEQVKERLGKFDLEVAEDKTCMLEFSKKGWKPGKRSESFDFLGFTHAQRMTRKGQVAVGLFTSKHSLNKGLKAINTWLRNVRNLLPLESIIKRLKPRMQGHFNYFGINGNYIKLQKFYWATKKLLMKWLNRRGSRKMTLDYFETIWQAANTPKPKIYQPILW